MHVGYAFAFIAGFLTFFAGCLIPIVPAYLGFLGGLSASSRLGSQAGRPFWLRPLFLNSLIFSAGFILIFALLGLTATTISNSLAHERDTWQRIGGVILILLGIYNSELISLPSLFKSWQLRLPPHLTQTHIGAFLLGLTFGFAWTPCIGPTLATILIFASVATSYWYGLVLLIIFGLGLALPFVVLGIAAQWLQPRLMKFRRWSMIIRWVFSLVMILAGVLLFTDRLGLFSQYFLHLTGPINF